MGKLKILYFEDDPMIAKSMLRALTGEGHDVKHRGAPDMSDPADFEWCDLVITDWDMPGGGGEEVIMLCARFWKPWLVISGNDEATMRLRRAGGYVLDKPARHAEIFVMLSRMQQGLAPDAIVAVSNG